MPEDDYAVEQISRNSAGIADHPEQEYKTWQRSDNNPEYIPVCIVFLKILCRIHTSFKILAYIYVIIITPDKNGIGKKRIVRQR